MSKYRSKNRLNVKQPAIMEEFYFGRSSGHFTGNFYPHENAAPPPSNKSESWGPFVSSKSRISHFR